MWDLSSPTRDRTHAPSIGSSEFNHWTTRESSWRRLLRVPWDCKEIQPVHPKRDQSWVFIGRTDVEAELKLQYFVHLMRRADSLEKTLMLGKIEGRRRRG